MNAKSGYDLEEKSNAASAAYQRDQLVEESFDRIKGQIKLETRNKIDQLFDAAEAGDQERYDKILDEIESKAKNMRS